MERHGYRSVIQRNSQKLSLSHDITVGLLKLKVHKENEGRRLLLRNSGTGKIIIVSIQHCSSFSRLTQVLAQNFNVHGGMNPSISKNVVSFMGHEDGASIPFKIRVKTADQAEQLKRYLDQEVEKARAKS